MKTPFLSVAMSLALGVISMIPADVGESDQDVVRLLDRLGFIDRGPAVTDKMFVQFEHHIGSKLPPEYGKFLRVMNGGTAIRSLALKNVPEQFRNLSGLELFSLRSDTLVHASDGEVENHPGTSKLYIGSAQVDLTVQLVLKGPHAGRVELTDRREPINVQFMTLRQFLESLQIVAEIDSYADLSSPQNAAIERFDSEDLKKLLKNGGDPNGRSPVGFPSLYYAALVCNVPAVKILLDAGANPNINDKHHETPIFRGCAEGIELLCKRGADVNHRNVHGRTAFFEQSNVMPRAVMLKKYGASLDIQDNNGRTAACEAAATGEFGRLSNILQLGARVDIADKDGNTPLHFVSSCENANVAIVVLLLDRNADVLTPNKNGDSCLSLMKTKPLWRNRRYNGEGPMMLERFEALAAKQSAERDRIRKNSR